MIKISIANDITHREQYFIQLIFYLATRAMQLLSLILFVCMDLILHYQIHSIGISHILSLLPPETRTQLASIPFSALLNSMEGATLVKRLINSVLKYYEGNPMSMFWDSLI